MTTKSRLLFLQRYLYENTDENHSISTNDLCKVLEENGFQANRKTVKNDVEMLIAADFDVLIDKDGKSNHFHYGTRMFQLPELKMLIDAVSSSRFISAEKSEVLIQKISSLASKYEAREGSQENLCPCKTSGEEGRSIEDQPGPTEA